MGSLPRHLLIVDDDPIIRDSLIVYLEDEGYHCSEAKNGQAMLDFLAAEAVDLAVLDLRMPVLTGVEALRRLRAAGNGTPVIIMSGAGDVHDVVSILRDGACDYLFKPIQDLGLLVQTIERALREQDLLEENRRHRENLESLVLERTQELEGANRRLMEKNITLKEVLSTIETEKRSLSRSIAGNISRIILPLLDQLRSGLPAGQQEEVDRIRLELENIAEPLLDPHKRQLSRLSRTELRVCQLIRRGLSAKEIADQEGMAASTVQTHRRNIRRKLGLAGSVTNLATYLEEME